MTLPTTKVGKDILPENTAVIRGVQSDREIQKDKEEGIYVNYSYRQRE